MDSKVVSVLRGELVRAQERAQKAAAEVQQIEDAIRTLGATTVPPVRRTIRSSAEVDADAMEIASAIGDGRRAMGLRAHLGWEHNRYNYAVMRARRLGLIAVVGEKTEAVYKRVA